MTFIVLILSRDVDSCVNISLLFQFGTASVCRTSVKAAYDNDINIRKYRHGLLVYICVSMVCLFVGDRMCVVVFV